MEREKLLQSVWPDSTVEEGNLSHNISVLRKVFDEADPEESCIQTVPKRGYRFTAPIREVSVSADGPASRSAASSLARGREALEKQDWPSAYHHLLEAAGEGDLGADDLARLATAARWTGHPQDSVLYLEAAATAYQQAGNAVESARKTLELSQLHFERRRPSLGTSRLIQAEKLLADQPEGPVHCFHAWLKNRSLWSTGDWDAALAQARGGLEMSRRLGERDTEALCLMDLGHIQLARARYGDAVPYLDQAGSAALAGELGPFAAGMVYCGLVFAWRARGNWRRAAEWTDAMVRWCEREKVAFFPGLCRIHRGEIFRLRGSLEEAERDLESACAELVAGDAWYAGVGFRELGEVRLRRGNLAGAEEAFRQALEMGTDPQPGLARLRFARGEVLEALSGLRLSLAMERGGSILDRENRNFVLPVLTTIALAAGETAEARAAVQEMEAVAAACDSSAHRASAAGARGEMCLAEGNPEEAIRHFQRSWKTWCEIDAPYEAAETRTKIGAALLRQGDLGGARLEMEIASTIFGRLGAVLDRRRTNDELERLPATPTPEEFGPGPAE